MMLTKKLTILILLLSLTGCSNQVDLGADIEVNEINVDGTMTSINYTDENVGEDIIIKADTDKYINIFGTFTAYLSVENLTGTAQDIDVVFDLKEGDVLEVFSYDGYTEEDIIIEEEESATSTLLGAKKEKTIKKVKTKWKKQNLKKATKYKKKNSGKMLGATSFTRKDIKETDATKQFTDSFEVGEKKFYKASIKIVSNDNEEFFIEAFGNVSGFGSLDPWTYTQNFDALTDGDLNGQDSWVGSTNVDVGAAYALLSTAKGITLGSANGTSINRAISSITSGKMYFAVKIPTLGVGGDGGSLRIRSGTSNAVNLSADYNGGSHSYQYNDGGTWRNLFSIDTSKTYILEVEFDCSPKTYSLRYKEEGGSWSSAINNIGFQVGTLTSVNDLRIINDGSATFWSNALIDEIGPTDPDTPAPTPSAPKSSSGPIWW